jgi:hypothetical protein
MQPASAWYAANTIDVMGGMEATLQRFAGGWVASATAGMGGKGPGTGGGSCGAPATADVTTISTGVASSWSSQPKYPMPCR